MVRRCRHRWMLLPGMLEMPVASHEKLGRSRPIHGDSTCLETLLNGVRTVTFPASTIGMPYKIQSLHLTPEVYFVEVRGTCGIRFNAVCITAQCAFILAERRIWIPSGVAASGPLIHVGPFGFDALPAWHEAGLGGPRDFAITWHQFHHAKGHKPTNGCCASLNDGSGFFFVSLIQMVNNGLEITRSVRQFPQQAVHGIQGPEDFLRCSKHPRKDSLKSAEPFFDVRTTWYPVCVGRTPFCQLPPSNPTTQARGRDEAREAGAPLEPRHQRSWFPRPVEQEQHRHDSCCSRDANKVSTPFESIQPPGGGSKQSNG